MKKQSLHAAVLFLAFLVAWLAPVRGSQAAPGDFISLWGAQQHLSGARGIAIDGNDNVYVTKDHTVQVFNSSGTRIKKWGSYGSEDGQLKWPYGIAVDGSGTVYVADTSNNRVQVFDSDGRFLRKWSPNFMPVWIATDGRGTVYVADGWTVGVFDSWGNFVRELDRIHWSSEYPWDVSGVTTDFQGNAYVVDRQTGRVHVYAPDGKVIRALQNCFAGYGIAVDRTGYVYVSDIYPDNPYGQIGVYDGAGNFAKGIGPEFGPEQEPDVGASEHYWQPMGLAMDSKGNLYTVDFNQYNDGLRVFDTKGAELPQWWTYGARAGQMSRPQGLAVDSSGNVYETDGHDSSTGILNNRVQVFGRDGNSIAKWTGSFAQSSGIAVDDGGNVYVLDTFNPNNAITERRRPASIVKVFDSSGTFSREWGDPGPNPDFYAIAMDKRGNLLISDRTNSAVWIFDTAGNRQGILGGAGSGDGQFNRPAGIAVDRYGDIFVVDSGNSRIQVFDVNYTLIRKWGSPGAEAGQFSEPAGIATDQARHLFVADSGNNRIQVFDAFGGYVGQWGSQGDDNGLFNRPEGVAADKNERIYVADSGNNRIQAFEGIGNTFTMSGIVQGVCGGVLPGTTVSIAGKSAVTNSQGAFGIMGIPSGSYTMTISPPGYPTQTENNVFVNFDFTNRIFPVLKGPYSFSGTIRLGSADGPPVAGATVSIGCFDTSTSSDGAFSFPDLPRGTYRLRVDSGNLAATVEGIIIDSDVSGRVYIVKPSYSVSGYVRDGSTTGPPIEGATVSIGEMTAVTWPPGNFSMVRVQAGTYTLTVSKPGYATKKVTNFIVDRDSKWTFYLKPGFSLSGTVHEGSATGPVLAGATVSIAGMTATTSSAGTFSIEGVPAGTYTVSVSKAGYQTRTISGYSISSDTSGASFFLAPASCTISGTIRQGSATGPPLAGATVSVAGKRATTSSTGTFTIAGIPPGTYTLYVSRTGYLTNSITGYAINSDLRDQVFYLTGAAFTLSGTIREGSSTGPVLQGATVSMAGKTATTGSTGTFSISDIPAGTYTVNISKAGYATKTVTGFILDRNKTLTYYLLKQ